MIFSPIYVWWCDNFSKAHKRQTEEWLRIEREAAIDAWEKKWGREHPSRKILRNCPGNDKSVDSNKIKEDSKKKKI